MAKSNDLGGVWRTINGNHVFIKDGQTVAEALEEDKKKKAKLKETENKPKETENKSDDDKRFAELKEKFDKGEIEKYSDEDYELRDRNLDKKVKEGILTKEEAEEQKLRNDFQTDRISRDEYEKRKGNFGEEMASDTPEKREERKKWREEQERSTSDVDKETAKANRQTEKIEKGKDDFDPVEFEKWRVENDPEFEMSDDTARYIYEIDKETGSRGGSRKETAEGRLEQLKKEGKVDSTGTKAVDKETQKEVNKLYLDTHAPTEESIASKYGLKDRRNEFTVKQYEDKTIDQQEFKDMMRRQGESEETISKIVEANTGANSKDPKIRDLFEKDKKAYMNIPQEERVKAFEEGKNWKDLVKEYNTRDSRGGLPGDDSLVEKGRKAGVSDEEIADAIYERHGGAESNNTSDDNIKRLLAKKAKEDAQANGYEDRAKMFENYEKEFNNRINQKKSTNDIMNDKIRNASKKTNDFKKEQALEYLKNNPTEIKEIAEGYDYMVADRMAQEYKIGKRKAQNIINTISIEDVENMRKEGTKNRIAEDIARKTYEKYKKEHPGSKISFEDFKKNK